jgi:1-acyl-sn-glycerol-3-phosphate acyltransferase
LSDLDRATAAEHLARLLSGWGAGTEEELLELLEAGLTALDEREFAKLIERTRTTGASWGFHAAEPFVRSLSRQIIERVLEPGSALEEGSGLAAARDTTALFVGNHLSYVDVNVLDCLLHRQGHADVADRITALVGPKVYTAPIRRLASLCFGTIKIPQSPSVASEQEVLPAREIARIAGESLDLVQQRSQSGDHLLIFPEGSRSRTQALRPLLTAAGRYLERARGVLIPFAHWGTERLVPLAEDHVYPSRVQVRVGSAFPLEELLARCSRKRALLVDVVGFLIADLLPPAYRGVYGEVDDGREVARKIASDLESR